ncbi:ATP-binding protein [Streptomyces sp. DSM 44917]|uniref:histidine kinase n=1 Tax=Streptomyces boetiae TaxID=3075541 RepID=A0ABU2L4T4_9ACTN|nr:ATP-binding protein [Streptomyces sp. DSM 44917]MDT0306571.1 ATP-binding protein [Streptomyces sp. DSM 44917]
MPEEQRTGARAARPGRSAAGSRLLRLAVLPAVLIAAIAAGAFACLLPQGPLPGPDGPRSGSGGGIPWGALAGAALLTVAVLAFATLAAVNEARAQEARLAELRRRSARGRGELAALLARVERGERVPGQDGPEAPGRTARAGTTPAAQPAPGERAAGPAVLPALPVRDPRPSPGDPFATLRREIDAARDAARTAVCRAAALARTPAEARGRAPRAGGGAERAAALVTLAGRMQDLVRRQLECLDELEQEAEDPELLRGLFQIDHLATRTRRHAENLAVLGGLPQRRRWSRPVHVSEVLRSCTAEVEQYARVELVPPCEGTVRGHAVADVVHLLAELVENATEFSAPQTRVRLRVRSDPAGLAVEVEDRGLGMTAAELARMNAVLAGSGRREAAELLADGRAGLFVVATLARRHGVEVRLRANLYGGTQAVLLLPHELLGAESEGRFTAGSALRTLPAAPEPPEAAAEAPAAGEAPAGTEPAGERPGAARPPLPRRRRLEHMAAQLRDRPRPAAPEAPAGPPDPHLLIAFLRGAGRAQEAVQETVRERERPPAVP